MYTRSILTLVSGSVLSGSLSVASWEYFVWGGGRRFSDLQGWGTRRHDGQGQLVEWSEIIQSGAVIQGSQVIPMILHTSLRADSRFAGSQWETMLHCNDVSLTGHKPRISPDHCSDWGKIYFKISTHKNIPYLTLMGKLWGVFCMDLGENWPPYNGTTLYLTGICLSIYQLNEAWAKSKPLRRWCCEIQILIWKFFHFVWNFTHFLFLRGWLTINKNWLR